MKLKDLFNEPKIIGVCGDVNEAKSNLLYHLIEDLSKDNKFKLCSYGLRNTIRNSLNINSVEELEQIRNSIIIIDEMTTLFDMDNRKAKRKIENTFRLIFHNNNVLILCALPENYKKFISGKITTYFFKKCTLADFINGSKIKNVVMGYKGLELGSSILNISKGETIYYDGLHYHTIQIPYYKKYDTKKSNVDILTKKCAKPVRNRVPNPVPKNVQKRIM